MSPFYELGNEARLEFSAARLLVRGDPRVIFGRSDPEWQLGRALIHSIKVDEQELLADPSTPVTAAIFSPSAFDCTLSTLSCPWGRSLRVKLSGGWIHADVLVALRGVAGWVPMPLKLRAIG